MSQNQLRLLQNLMFCLPKIIIVVKCLFPVLPRDARFHLPGCLHAKDMPYSGAIAQSQFHGGQSIAGYFLPRNRKCPFQSTRKWWKTETVACWSLTSVYSVACRLTKLQVAFPASLWFPRPGVPERKPQVDYL